MWERKEAYAWTLVEHARTLEGKTMSFKQLGMGLTTYLPKVKHYELAIYPQEASLGNQISLGTS